MKRTSCRTSMAQCNRAYRPLSLRRAIAPSVQDAVRYMQDFRRSQGFDYGSWCRRIVKTPETEVPVLGQAQARPGYNKLGFIAVGELPYQDFGYRHCHATGSDCSSQNPSQHRRVEHDIDCGQSRVPASYCKTPAWTVVSLWGLVFCRVREARAVGHVLYGLRMVWSVGWDA